MNANVSLLELKRIGEIYEGMLVSEAKNVSIIRDEDIDDSSVKEWSVFTDEKINGFIRDNIKNTETAVNEDSPIDGKDWRKLSFWGKLKDTIASGVNYDGSEKGRFELRKFPTKVIKAEQLTPELTVDTFRKGFNIKLDTSSATKEQIKHASDILFKMHDREVLVDYDKYMGNLGDAAGTAGAIYGGIKGGSTGAAAGGLSAKTAVTKYSDEFVKKFNEDVKGTEFAAMAITQEDLGRAWYERLLLFVTNHPYITIGAVIAAYVIFRKREWIWDSIKLGIGNLWQGTVIAKYEFKLINGTPLTFEYDLRFNKWRFLFNEFQWSGDSIPSKEMMVSFKNTRHFKDFLNKCVNGMKFWFSNEQSILEIVEMNTDESKEDSVKLIKEVFDDKEDILNTFEKVDCRVG